MIRKRFLPVLSEYDPMIGWIRVAVPVPIRETIPPIVRLKPISSKRNTLRFGSSRLQPKRKTRKEIHNTAIFENDSRFFKALNKLFFELLLSLVNQNQKKRNTREPTRQMVATKIHKMAKPNWSVIRPPSAGPRAKPAISIELRTLILSPIFLGGEISETRA